MHVLPLLNDFSAPPESGSLFETPPFCHRADRGKCLSYYESIRERPGIHRCPYGYSTAVAKRDGQAVVFSGLKVAGFYDAHKINKRGDRYFSPELNEELLERAIDAYYVSHNLQRDQQRMKELLQSVVHEVRTLNAEIKQQSEETSKEAAALPPDLDKVRHGILALFGASTLISTHLDFYDYLQNPSMITAGDRILVGVYKKFEKAKHCMEVTARRKKVRIRFEGECYVNIDALRVFDILPVVLLENAVKFSPSEAEIEIRFFPDERPFRVEVASMGPLLEPGEGKLVFNKGYRGVHGRDAKVGTGMGLSFAKIICDYHSIDIDVRSGHVKYELNGIPYAEFVVTLRFRSSYGYSR